MNMVYTGDMLLVSHIIIALFSVVYATYGLLRPSRSRVRVSYGLMALTVGSGTLLVVRSHAPLLPSCVTGLLYVAGLLGLTRLAYYRLTHERSS